MVCARSDDHTIKYFVRLLRSGEFVKIGQYPSLADIALDASKNYSKVLPKEDRAEFHRAIGLAAHGVGIGSFVYLRRIFERLIRRRFDEHRVAKGWDEADYARRRMEEKIELMADVLPSFLVANKRTYALLSLGLHELDEQTCLSMFNVLKMSIIFILEEDNEKRKKEEMRKQVEADLTKLNQLVGRSRDRDGSGQAG